MTMKKWAALLLAVLLVLNLGTCQDDKHVSGALVEVQTDENGDLTALILERDGKRTGILLAEKTGFWPMGEGSWTGEEARAEFQRDLQPGNQLSAWCYPRREKLETAEGETVPAYWGQDISVDGVLERNALTLRDGTNLDVMKNRNFGNDRTYQLPDGTELLRVTDEGGPENHYVMNLESFDDLTPRAQERVRAWYEAQAPLYDEREELERSYAAYRELGEEFGGDMIQQNVSPAASNENVMYFVTSLLRPEEHGRRFSYELQLGAAFDRETGEKFSNWDLFAVPEAEVRRRLPELCGWVDDPEVRKAMSEALEEDMLVFFPDHVSVSFPPGSLPGEENSFGIGLNYQDAPEGFFQPWAIPVSREE